MSGSYISISWKTKITKLEYFCNSNFSKHLLWHEACKYFIIGKGYEVLEREGKMKVKVLNYWS